MAYGSKNLLYPNHLNVKENGADYIHYKNILLDIGEPNSYFLYQQHKISDLYSVVIKIRTKIISIIIPMVLMTNFYNLRNDDKKRSETIVL